MTKIENMNNLMTVTYVMKNLLTTKKIKNITNTLKEEIIVIILVNTQARHVVNATYNTKYLKKLL